MRTPPHGAQHQAPSEAAGRSRLTRATAPRRPRHLGSSLAGSDRAHTASRSRPLSSHAGAVTGSSQRRACRRQQGGRSRRLPRPCRLPSHPKQNFETRVRSAVPSPNRGPVLGLTPARNPGHLARIRSPLATPNVLASRRAEWREKQPSDGFRPRSRPTTQADGDPRRGRAHAGALVPRGGSGKPASARRRSVWRSRSG